MLFGKFSENIKSLKLQVKIQNVTVMVLAISLVVVSFLFYSAVRSKRTIILPSTIMAAMEVSDTDASPEFVRINTVYALSLLYSYTPTSAAGRFEEFLIAYVQLDKVRELRPMLMERLRQIQSVKVAESLEVDDFIFEKRGALLIKGKTHRYSIGEPIATEPVYLRLLYRVLDGNLKIQSLVALDGPEFMRRVRAVQITGKKVEETERKKEAQKRREEKKDARKQEIRERRGDEPDSAVGSDPFGAVEEDEEDDVERIDEPSTSAPAP